MHPENTIETSSAAAKLQMLHQAQDESAAASSAAATATAAATAALEDSEPDVETVSIKQVTPRKVQSLDVDSLSMFPSLGSSAAPRPAATTATWGARTKSTAGKLGAVGDQRRTPAAAAAAAAAAASAPRISGSGNIQERMQIPSIQVPGFGKSTVGDHVKTAMASSGARIESTTSQATGLTTFLISGKPEAVAKARLALRSSFAKKEKVEYLVPSSARPHLLGSKGRTLNAIQTKTGVQINIPRRKEGETTFEPATLNEDDLDAEEEMVPIDIEGDVESIKAAKEEIESIISKACRITYRLTTIPASYYPFIAGARNVNIQAIQQDTNTRINMPFHVSSQDDEDDEDAKDTAIVIQGDRKSIRKAIERIENNYTEIERTTRVMTINIPKRQHRFLVGTKGVHINEIHAATGCTIEIPPVDSTSDSIVVRGPEAELIPALTLIMEKANSSQVESVDVTVVHKPVAGKGKTEHARHVTKYLSARNKLRKIEQEHEGVQINVPRTEGQTAVTIEIVAKSRTEVEAARAKVQEAVKAMTPVLFDTVQVEPLLHRHIVGRKGQNINRLREAHGVEVIVPDANSDSHEIILVFEVQEGVDVSDVTKIRAALEAVKQEVDKLANDATDFSTKVLSVPARLHRNVIGTKGSTLNAIMGLEPTTSVRLGLPRAGSADVTKKAGTPALTEDSIVIKGPKDEVERVAREILALVEETKHQQVMNSYSVTFDIPATASPHVIGKGGANINKLTEQFQVKFDLNDRAAGADDKTKKKTGNETMEVTIQGVKKNVETAKETIIKMVEQIADATVAKLNIPVAHHSALIGAKGHYVRRLEEKYGVRIQFPKAADLEDDEDQSKLNVVLVSGGKKGVQGAKEELLELLDYEKENNNTLELIVEPKMLPHIVGRSGTKINEIQESSQTRIDIRRSTDSDEKAEVRLVINGSKAGLKQAQKAIHEIIEAQKSQVEELVEINNKHHKILIGQGGSTLREIIAKAGGPSEMSAQAGLVKFQSSNNAVLLKGDKTIVEKIKAEMLTMVAEQDSWTTISIQIPASQHRQVIGPQFSHVKEIENRHSVRIQFPNNKNKKEGGEATTDNAANERVTIKGLHENCEKAKVDLEARIKSSASRSFSIPKRHRQAVFGDGVWKYRNEFNVVVVLPRGEGGRNNNGASKRIDADDNQVTHGLTDGLSWELYDLSGPTEESDEAQFTVQLQGTETGCEAVEKHLQGLLEKARASTHVLKIRVPTTYHGLIIGSGGNNIKQIEAESGTSTKIARGEELITITGSKEGVEKAKVAILRVVNSSEKRA
ncbi:hypothetical protein EC957_004555 [Mortierella hygrophila]|uniref:K Homology domain-containing protein n=1 Tax=Mortierella hygrophila TaxID=979708 RepID=A0A9P6K707_9FUNG|nr:hypothetical protein EC957_004555 [Mortierella hygrophila]